MNFNTGLGICKAELSMLFELDLSGDRRTTSDKRAGNGKEMKVKTAPLCCLRLSPKELCWCFSLTNTGS